MATPFRFPERPTAMNTTYVTRPENYRGRHRRRSGIALATLVTWAAGIIR